MNQLERHPVDDRRHDERLLPAPAPGRPTEPERDPSEAELEADASGPEDGRTDGLLGGFASATGDLVAVIDADHVILAANPAWEPTLGCPAIELVGRPLLTLVHPDDVPSTRSVLRSVLDGGGPPRTVTNRLRASDGTWRRLGWSLTRSLDGPYVFLSGRDLTELEQLDRRRDTFLRAVAHDLRTPLVVIEGMARTLHDQRETLEPAEIGQLEDTIVAESARATRLVSDLLDLDRFGSVRRQETDLVTLVERVVAASAVEERVELSAPTSVEVAVDPVQIERMVANLLENAAKYAPDGPVTVTLTRAGDQVRLAVRDRGPGIPSDALERVFEPFWRSGSARRQAGSGLGLALVAEFADLHGGRAWAEPADDGAHLVVELPVHAG